MIYYVLGVTGAWWVFQIWITRWEKRMVWPYEKLDAFPKHPDPGGFGARRVNEAIANRFRFLGWASDAKGDKYKINYAFFVSPESDALAVVAVGTLFGIEVRGTNFY